MELTVVAVSQAEREQNVLNQDTAFTAHKALYEAGAVVLRGAFPVVMIDALHQEFAGRYANLDQDKMLALSQQQPPNPIQKVGDGRYELAIRMNGGFGQMKLLANGILVNFLSPLLGGAQMMRLGSVTAVASFPGAQMQHAHRDHDQLFKEFAQIGPALPLFAVNCSIPLIDIDQSIGPTAIWPGTHRSAADGPPMDGMVSIPFQRGDCVMMDYRTMHTGMPNNSQTVRPILYLVYTREWFFDDNNHRTRAPLDMTMEEVAALPQEYHLLLMRAYQNAVRARQLASA
jgi:hypothetical protein